MNVIGLAGPAGSGKSAIARHLSQRPGIEWIDLDAVAWQTYARGTAPYEELVAAFGEDILGIDGEVDRRQLAARAFADPTSTATLNRIVHPAVSQAIATAIRDHRARGTELLLVEGALLASSPYVDRSLYDRIVWLDVPPAERRRRLDTVGRGGHARRNEGDRPRGSVLVVAGSGTIEQVAERLLAAVRGTAG